MAHSAAAHLNSEVRVKVQRIVTKLHKLSKVPNSAQPQADCIVAVFCTLCASSNSPFRPALMSLDIQVCCRFFETGNNQQTVKSRHNIALNAIAI